MSLVLNSPKILNLFLVLNVPDFMVYQGSEYLSAFEYARILNMQKFWICQGRTGFGAVNLDIPFYFFVFS